MTLLAFSTELPWTALLNKAFGGLAAPLMETVGVHPHDPAHPITNFVAMEILVFLLLVVGFLIVRSRLSVEAPGGLQHTLEGLDGFIRNLQHEIIGHKTEAFTGFLVTLGLFILACNLLGMIPGFESPTAVPAVPLGCAVVAFLYYHWQGIRKQGVLHYMAHFAGPMIWLAPLMVPIEIISHLARILSLTVRLFANIFAGDMVLLVFFSLVPLGVPVVFLGLHVFVAFLQAYIFVLLTTVYLSGAVAEEH